MSPQSINDYFQKQTYKTEDIFDISEDYSMYSDYPSYSNSESSERPRRKRAANSKVEIIPYRLKHFFLVEYFMFSSLEIGIVKNGIRVITRVVSARV